MGSMSTHEMKRVSDLTQLDVGRNVTIVRGDVEVTGPISLVSHLDIQGWRVGGDELTNQAYVTVGVGLWTSTLYYHETVTFIEPVDFDRELRRNPGEMRAAIAERRMGERAATAERIRVAQERAFDEGFTACAGEHTKQRRDPKYPITRHNPYRSQP